MKVEIVEGGRTTKPWIAYEVELEGGIAGGFNFSGLVIRCLPKWNYRGLKKE